MPKALDFSTDNWSFLTAHIADQEHLFPTEPDNYESCADPLTIIINNEESNDD